MALSISVLLEGAKNSAFSLKDRYTQASDEIQAFKEKVERYEQDKQEWEQLLRKYSLPHSVTMCLEEAVKRLEEQKKVVELMEDRCCCLTFWEKEWSTEQVIDNLKAVEKAFEGIRDYLEEKQNRELLAEQEAAKIIAPFSFARERKYVPVMGTVEKVCKALEGDGASQKVVLVHGGSGEGKSTLAKYLALDYYNKSKGPSSSPSSLCRYSDGVVFISCGENADSYSLMKKLWLDLGYSRHASQLRGVQWEGTNGGKDLELLKRSLMGMLDNGQSILIILDDVWEQGVIGDLMISAKGVNYLITSQQSNIWPDAGGHVIVQIGFPSTEEASKILANHIVGWNGKPFPDGVQKEVDLLIRRVGNHPLLIANLGTLIKCKEVGDLDIWIQLRNQLGNAIQAAHLSVPKLTMYDVPYKLSAVASLTMVMDRITGEARSLLFLMAICTGRGVDEHVLKLWFKALHGPNKFLFNVAYEDYLQARSLILVTENEIERGNGFLFRIRNVNMCTIHDFRRELLAHMYKEEIEGILEKLIGRKNSQDRGTEGLVSSDGSEVDLVEWKGTERLVSSDESEEALVAALFFAYGDKKYYRFVKNRLKVHDNLLFHDGSHTLSVFRAGRRFFKIICRLLHPRLEEASVWETTVHGLARNVILHFLQFSEVKYDAVLKLLEIPQTFLVTSTAITRSLWCPGLERTYTTLRTLAKPFGELHSGYYGSFVVFSPPLLLSQAPRAFMVVEHLFIILEKHLKWWSTRLSSQTSSVLLVILFALEAFFGMTLVRTQLVTAPGMLETLLSFLDSERYSDLKFLRKASRVFRQVAYGDFDIKAKIILLPNVWSSLVRMLPFTPESTLESLKELAWTSENAESIVSSPGALEEIVRLLTDIPNIQSIAILCFGQLASFPQARSIIASRCPSAFRRLIQLLQPDISPALLKDIAMAVRKIVSDDTEFEYENSATILTEVLHRLDLLLVENVHVTVRSQAVHALEILAFEETICKRLGAYPGLLEKIVRILAYADTTVECMETVNRAVRAIFIEGEGLAESQRMALVADAVEMYKRLLQDDKTDKYEVQRRAARGLANIFRRQKSRRVMDDAGVNLILMIHMRKDPTFYMSTEGVHIMESFLEGENLKNTEKIRFQCGVLKSYVALLSEGVDMQQEDCVVAMAQLTHWPEIRQLLTDGDTVERLLERLVTKQASPLILVCAAETIYRVSCTAYDESKRMTLLTRTLERYVALLIDGIGTGLREAAVEGLLILASTEEIQKLLLRNEKTLDLLLGLVREDSSPQTLRRIAYLLQNILAKRPKQEKNRVVETESRAVESYVGLILADRVPSNVQAGALEGLTRFAFREEKNEVRVASPRAFNQLTRLLRVVDFRVMLRQVCEVVQVVSACRMVAEDFKEDMRDMRSYALQSCISVMEDDVAVKLHKPVASYLVLLLHYESNRKLFPSICPNGEACLTRFVDLDPQLTMSSMESLTLIDPVRADAMNVSSFHALAGRVEARVMLRQYRSALEDIDRALEWTSQTETDEWARLLDIRGFIKAMSGNVAGALEDFNGALKSITQEINESRLFFLQERGILKSFMPDYNEALLDLNESLRFGGDDYEVLKHRGYVKFLLKDEDGARFDARQAQCTLYRKCSFKSLDPLTCLGTLPVKYLEFEL